MRNLIDAPLVLAVIDHTCNLCEGPILRGERYHDDDRDRKAHENCARRFEAVSAGIRKAGG